jgi:hypothetical protein
MAAPVATLHEPIRRVRDEADIGAWLATRPGR